MATYTGNSIVDYLGSIGQASDFGSRTNLAKKYNIANYSGTAEQNTNLLNSLRGTPANPSGTGMTSVKPITASSSALSSPAAQSYLNNQSNFLQQPVGNTTTAHSTPQTIKQDTPIQYIPNPATPQSTMIYKQGYPSVPIDNNSLQMYLNNGFSTTPSGGGYSTPAYNAQGTPNFSTQPKAQVSTPAYGAGGTPNFSSTPSGTTGGDPYAVFGSVNGRNYNYAGEWLNDKPTQNWGVNGNTNSSSVQTGTTGTEQTTNGTTGTTGDTVVRGDTSAYTTPDRQAYIDAYKKYIDAQTNNEDVKNAKTAYNDFITEQAKSIAGQEGRGFGVPLSLVRGTQAKLKAQTDPEAQRLQNAIGIAQTGQTNMISGAKSGADLEKNLLDFGQSDFTNKNTLSTQDRLNNPDFNIGEGQVRYVWDGKSGQYKAIKGPAKTYKPTTGTKTTVDKVSINKGMTTKTFKAMTPEEQADWIRYQGGNPVDFGL